MSQPWEQEIIMKLAEQELNILKSTDEDLFNKLTDSLEKAEALSTIEKAYKEGHVSHDILIKARSKAGVYADTPANRKKGIVGAKYKGGMGEKEEGKDKKNEYNITDKKAVLERTKELNKLK